MSSSPRKVTVLGSTGSIGTNTLEVIQTSGGRLLPFAITGSNRVHELKAQAITAAPNFVVACNPESAKSVDWSEVSKHSKVLYGADGIREVVQHPETEIVLNAIVGSAGLNGSLWALEKGKKLALANKETLVVAGSLITEVARANHATIFPVDSEHSAVFQAIRAGTPREVSRIILTASGGPFRTYSKESLKRVTVEETLQHPTWRMGQKITVDSATMMNKALEIIEARWLFDVPVEEIHVVVHPQSIVHAIVEFVDGSMISQMSPPDMRLPIQLALSDPERWVCQSPKLEFQSALRLDFEPPDEDRFPALRLGFEVARAGGTAGAVLNASNEAAVDRFLKGEIRYHEIVPLCESVLRGHTYDPNPTLENLMRLDRWAREEVYRWIG